MNDRDKQLLINEINKWRKSKLLPSAYCDFLINLYSAGASNPNNNIHTSQNKDKKSLLKKGFLFLLIITLISVSGLLVFKFTTFSQLTQIAILLLLPISMYIITILYKKKGSNPILLLLIHSFASVSLAVVATYGSFILGIQEQQSTLQFVFLCVFIIWLSMGLWLHHLMVFIASIAGIALIVNQLIVNSVLGSNLLYAQFYWLPITLIMLWISYAINQHHKYYKQSIILFIYSIVFFFMPEIGLLVYGNGFEGLQYIVPTKAILLVFMIYFASKNMIRSRSNNQVEA